VSNFKNADSLAREHTEQAIDVLAEVMADPFAENRERINAANSLLDRGHGKPNQAIIAVPASRQQAALLAAMSDDELMAAITQARLPRLGPIDAEFAEVPDPLLR
jgi:cellobiose-specific phosphotransferase system component IIA